MPSALLPHRVNPAPARWRRVAVRAAVLAGFWILLTGGNLRSWLVGLPAVAAATAVSVAWQPSQRLRLRWRGVPAFIAYFLVHSLRGGLDVAARALSRRPRLRPAILRIELQLPPGPPQLLLGAVTSLLPGTLLVGMEANAVELHVLDHTANPVESLRRLEARVAGVFRLDVGPAEESR